MTENLLKEAMDCGWVTMGIRVPPPPPTWNFVVDLSKRWSTMDEPDFWIYWTYVFTGISSFSSVRGGGAYTAHVRVLSLCGSSNAARS